VNFASPPRRVKTFTADSGYVYQYYFVGKRAALPDAPEAPATEFIFDVTRDRKAMFAFSVFVQAGAIEGWAAAHGRTLTEPEQYAAAKLRLLRGFEEIGDRELRQHSRHFVVDAANVSELLAEIGLE